MKTLLSMSSVLVLGLPAILGACSLTDPSEREGLWHPRGVNNGNLAAMIADPHDLVQGRGSFGSDGVLAAAAVDRLYRDKVKQPNSVGISQIGGGGAPASGGAGATDTAP